MSLIDKLTVVSVVALLFGSPFAVLIQAKFESATYNKLTGAETTWWDALWVELRVNEAPKGVKEVAQ